MRPSLPLLSLAVSTLAAFALVATVLISPDFATAEEGAPPPDRSSDCAQGKLDQRDKDTLWPRPSFAGIRPELDERDEKAALESVQRALSEAGDGATYVWHRAHGRLSGFVKPTRSFKDGDGRICRHMVLMLSSGTRSKQTEGIACRLANGLWQLEG